MKKNKRGRIGIILVIILIFAVIFLLSYVAVKQDKGLAFFRKPLILGLLIAISLTSVSATVYLIIFYGKLIAGLKQTGKLVNDISKGYTADTDDIDVGIPILKIVNSGIRDIAEGQKKQVAELRQRTSQLDEMNSELNKAYIQLESSYGQLKAVMEQLNESEQRYHSLVVNIPDIVLTLDKFGNITYANRACRDILKFRRHDIVGKPFQYIIHPDSAENLNIDNIKESIEKYGKQSRNIPLRRKDDSLILTEIKFTAVAESPETDGIQAIIRDVTEQVRIENTLLETNRRLKILNSLNHRLASTVEPSDIYRYCVSTVTNELGYCGCIYFSVEKSERFYKIMSYSGEYFKHPGNLEQFCYIHRNTRTLSEKNGEGIVLKYDMAIQSLVMDQVNINPEAEFVEAFFQELRSCGEPSGIIMVLSNNSFLSEEIDVLRSIGHSTAVAVENAVHFMESKSNFVKTIDALIMAIEARDQYTKGHSQRVSKLAVQIACKLGMSRQQAEELQIAGILHDIGKVGIGDNILYKNGPLTNEENEEIKRHPAISNKILHSIGLSDKILKAVAFHHEHYDGSGYPFGLTNDSLGYEPQIIAVADAYDAMTSARPYRKPMSWQMAVCELEKCKGSQFHPDIVDSLVQILIEENSMEDI